MNTLINFDEDITIFTPSTDSHWEASSFGRGSLGSVTLIESENAIHIFDYLITNPVSAVDDLYEESILTSLLKLKKNNKNIPSFLNITKKQKKNNIRFSFLKLVASLRGDRDSYISDNICLPHLLANCARGGSFTPRANALLRDPVVTGRMLLHILTVIARLNQIGMSDDSIFDCLATLPSCVDWIKYFDFEVTHIIRDTTAILSSARSIFSIPYRSTNYLKIFEILVGVEPNPGPNKTVSRASAHKRAIAIVELLRQKDIEKKIDQQLRSARDKKYQPEGMFDVSLDVTTKKFLEDLVGTLSSTLKNLSIVHRVDLTPPEFITSILSWIKNATVSVKRVLVGIVKLLVSFMPPKVRDFYNLIAGFVFPECIVVQAQDFYECEMNVPLNSFMALLYSENFSDAFEKLSFTKFFTTLVDIKKGSMNASTGFNVILSIIREVVVFLNDTFGLNIPSFGEPTELNPIAERLKSIQLEYREGMISEYAFADRVFTLQDEMETMLYSKRANLEPIVKERLTYMLRKFQTIVSYCEKNINPNNGPRIEPLAMLIAGPSGVGKSTVTVPFLLALMNNILPDDKKIEFKKNHNDFMFFRANENEFWDGYKMRNVAIVYDDFGQQKDSAGNPNPDAFEIIRLKNTAPYHLHFASLEDKQRNYAAPKLIFATSNRSQLHFESIISNEAVVRRFDLSFVQVPKLQYCYPHHDTNAFSRKLDIEKVRAEFPYDPKDPSTFAELSIMEFIEWDFIRGEPKTEGRILSFDGLLKLAIKSFQTISTKGDAMLAFHESMKSYVPEMFEPEKDAVFGLLDEWSTFVLDNIAGKYARSKLLASVESVCSSTTTDILKFVGSIAACLCAAYSFLSISQTAYTFLFGTQPVPTSNETTGKPRANNKGQRNSQRNRTTFRSGQRAAKANARTEGQTVSIFSTHGAVPNLDAYYAILKRQTYRVEVRGAILGSCLFFGPKSFLWPRHFTDHILNLDAIEESEGDDWKEIVTFIDPITGLVAFRLDFFSEIYHMNAPNRFDISFLTVTVDKIRMHRNIIDMFPKADGTMKFDSQYDAQVMVHRDHGWVAFNTRLGLNSDIKYSNVNGEYSSRHLVYTAPSAVGDCGVFILVNDTRFPTPQIFGFHTAGSAPGVFKTKNCAGVMLFQEELSGFLRDANVDPEFSEEPIVTMVPEVRGFEGFKVLSERKMPRMPLETKLIPSPMAGLLWETTTKPAHLKPFFNGTELIDPGVIARKNYSHDEVYIDSEKLDVAFSHVSNLIQKRHQPEPHPARLFSFREAVEGIDGLDFVDAINRTTSAGYPFVLETGGSRGKSKWFGNSGKIDFDTEPARAIADRVDFIVSQAKKNVRLNHIFIDILKDEKRPIAKVDIGKTRQIMACPEDLLIAMKMYFGDFIRHVMSNRIFNGVAIGIDPFSEWCNLADYMRPTPVHVFTAGDYSGYDGKIPVPIALKCLKVIDQFYAGCPKEDDVVRRILFEEIINSKHLSRGLVYEFYGGNPSGQPLTSVFNSICNLLILTYTSVCIVDQHDNAADFDISAMFDRTRFQTFGDDNVISYHPDDSFIWSQDVLEKAIPFCVGMKYTNEFKDGLSVSARPLEAIQFLKRGFRYESGICHCPLELSVLKETLSWQQSNGTIDQMFQRIEATLSELARHGKHVFDECTPRIIAAALQAYQYSPKNHSYRLALASGDTLAV